MQLLNRLRQTYVGDGGRKHSSGYKGRQSSIDLVVFLNFHLSLKIVQLLLCFNYLPHPLPLQLCSLLVCGRGNPPCSLLVVWIVLSSAAGISGFWYLGESRVSCLSISRQRQRSSHTCLLLGSGLCGDSAVNQVGIQQQSWFSITQLSYTQLVSLQSSRAHRTFSCLCVLTLKQFFCATFMIFQIQFIFQGYCLS